MGLHDDCFRQRGHELRGLGNNWIHVPAFCTLHQIDVFQHDRQPTLGELVVAPDNLRSRTALGAFIRSHYLNLQLWPYLTENTVIRSTRSTCLKQNTTAMFCLSAHRPSTLYFHSPVFASCSGAP